MKKQYEAPELSLVLIGTDVITTSLDPGDQGTEWVIQNP
jgi:hypothetical protein